MDIDIEKTMNLMVKLTMYYGPKLLGAVAVWIIGGWIIKMIGKGFSHVLEAQKIDPSLKPFLKSLITALLQAMLVITVLSMLGVQMTSFIAILGAAGLAVGMALSGTLQNFAGGVVILLFKPFRVGDLVEAEGYTGFVHEIHIFNTILKTPDNRTVIIPNGSISGSTLANYSTEETRRVDFTFGIAYGDSVEKAREIVRSICTQDARVLQDPEAKKPFVGLSELADSSVNLAVRVWVKGTDYWPVFFELNEKIYKGFQDGGIQIPFPQMDVHLDKA